jgi:hypothetical protein
LPSKIVTGGEIHVFAKGGEVCREKPVNITRDEFLPTIKRSSQTVTA